MSKTLDYAVQRQFILEARFTVSEDRAARYLEQIERLARDKTIVYSTRNRVRSELKDRGFSIPARQQSRRI